MSILQPIVWVLLLVLVVAGIAAVIKLIKVLDEASKALETTRRDLDKTMQRVDGVVTSLQTVLTEEVTPTIRVARQTIEHLEVTARAASDATEAARRTALHIESVMQSSKLAAAGGAIAKAALQRSGSTASHMLSSAVSGLGHSVMSMVRSRFSRKHEEAAEVLSLPPAEQRNGSVRKLAAAKRR